MVFGANVNATEPFSNDYLYPCSSLCESLFGMFTHLALIISHFFMILRNLSIKFYFPTMIEILLDFFGLKM